MNLEESSGADADAVGGEAERIIARLGLVPHPKEGGWFRETYRAAEALAPSVLTPPGSAPRYAAARAVSTAIYYLLTPTSFSALHRLASDEVFHFYAGDPVEQLRLFPGGGPTGGPKSGPNGGGEVVNIGNDLAAGQHPQTVVPRGVWQGARLAAGGRYALLGCTVAPGFDYADYEAGDRLALSQAFPDFADRIAALTPA